MKPTKENRIVIKFAVTLDNDTWSSIDLDNLSLKHLIQETASSLFGLVEIDFFDSQAEMIDDGVKITVKACLI